MNLNNFFAFVRREALAFGQVPKENMEIVLNTFEACFKLELEALFPAKSHEVIMISGHAVSLVYRYAMDACAYEVTMAGHFRCGAAIAIMDHNVLQKIRMEVSHIDIEESDPDQGNLNL